MVTLSCKNVTFSNIKAVVFDKDGTLENSSNELRELAITRTRLIDAQIPGTGDPLLMAFGVLEAQLDPQGLMAVGSRRENQIAAAAYIAETGRGWMEALGIAESAFTQADENFARNAVSSPLFEGVLPVLTRLHQAGLQLAILSADSDENVRQFATRHNLAEFCTVTRGLKDDGLLKPDPALFLDVCDRLQLPPSEVVMVGDAGSDWQMARTAGAGGVIGIHWGNASGIPAEVVDVAIDDLAAIETI